MTCAGVHPSSKLPDRELQREVIATPRIERVEIAPRPDTVRVGEFITLRVCALDRDGHEFAGLPWTLEVLDGVDRSIRSGPERASLAFTAPGRIRIESRLGVCMSNAFHLFNERRQTGA